MIKQQVSIVIAALLITSMALSISTTSVSAAHAPAVEITPTLTTKGDMDFDIKVKNTGGDPITSVDVDLPFDVDGWVGTLMADNVAPSTSKADNTVLFAGTKIPITIIDLLTLTEGTPITLGKTWKAVKLETWGDATAEWTKKQAHTGDYSVKLSTPASPPPYEETGYGKVIVPLHMDDFVTLEDFSFWFKQTIGTGIPFHEISVDVTVSEVATEDANITTDALKNAARVIIASQPEHTGFYANYTEEGWLEYSESGAQLWDAEDVTTGWRIYWYDANDQCIGSSATKTYSWAKIHEFFNGNASVKDVRVEMRYTPDASTVYVDDISIGETLYPIEPTVVFETGIDIEPGVTVIVPAGTEIGESKIPAAPKGKSTGAKITAFGITDETNVITLTVDGVAYGPYTIVLDGYDSGTLLVGAINLATDAGGKELTTSGATATFVEENIVFTSGTTGSKSSVHVDPESSAATTLGFGPDDEVTETPGAGTVVTLLYDTYVTMDTRTCLTKLGVVLPSEDSVKLPKGTEIELIKATGVNLLSATLPADTHLVLKAVDGARLCEDTEGTIGPDDIEDATLISKTACPLVADNEMTFLPTSDAIKVPKGTKVVLALTPTAEKPIGSELELTGGMGAQVTLWGASTVVLVDGVNVWIEPTAEFTLPNSEVTATLTERKEIMLPKDTEIELPEGAMIELKDDEEDNAKLSLPIPSDWMVTAATGKEATWENATPGGAIGPGESRTFSIRADIDEETVVDGKYLWTITTTDVEDKTEHKTLTTTVDSIKPTILKVTMEPEMVGAGPATIKVVASEKLSNLDKVYYQLDDNEDHIGDTEHLIAMGSANDITWTGTLTIPGDGLWDDNTVDIVVLAELTKDMAGNTPREDNDVNIHSTANRHIDTIPPVLPANLEMTDTTPFDNEVNQKSQLITGTAQDNLAGEATPQDNLTVEIRVGTTTYETTSFADGAFTKEIDLAEGPNTIKVWVIDELGNVGPENAQSVFLDSLKPTISMDSVAGETYKDDMPVNDNTPTVVLTIKDPGYPDTALGIEYENITVTLENADDFTIELENATPWNNTTGRFENTIPLTMDDFTAGLPDGSYSIVVTATDVLNNSNEATFKFEVDTIAPDAPTVIPGSVLDRTTAVKPYVTKEPSVSISGDGDPGDTVNVYLDDETTPTETANVASTGKWGAKISLAGGHVTRISVSETDVAGNESAKEVWGYAMSDASAPAVTLAELPETTDSASIVISGTVTKDAWEDWSDIALTVQIGTGKVEVPCVGGSYEYSLELSEGSNTIVVQAVDAAGNPSDVAHATVERTVTPWGLYAIVFVIIALVLAAVAVFKGPRSWKR